MTKIEEAQDILKQLDVPKDSQNRIAALTFLALCYIGPITPWNEAQRKSMTLSKDIMEFISRVYGIKYKANTRESIRKSALKPFVEHGIADLNPDNPSLPQNSSLTHYSITERVLNTVKSYQTSEWQRALDTFHKLRSIAEIVTPDVSLKSIKINNYKSIEDDKIELGRFNVFIGANGCGKTNILEAIAMVGADRANDLSFEGLYSRGVRIARPDLMLSSFLKDGTKSSIDMQLQFESANRQEQYHVELSPSNLGDPYTKWVNLAEEELYPKTIMQYFTELLRSNPSMSGSTLIDNANQLIDQRGLSQKRFFDSFISEYAIFDLNTKALRGISVAESKKTPLGLNGEGLDLLIGSFHKGEKAQLDKCLSLFDWLKEIVPDKDDKLKSDGLKPGRSTSTLYFQDKFMESSNNTFSAENSNEGVLHVLFYLALFISNKTPRLLGIDNIETALNPRLCQALVVELVKLAKQNNKQALITTHNPAILDGLNLLDDEQRLFEVYRSSDGKTQTRRIKFKPDLSDKRFKLSELWLKGLIGAVPKNF